MSQEGFCATFCRNIRYLRKKHKLTQKEMAEKLCISVGYVRMLEQGKVPARMQATVLLDTRASFGISPDDLLRPIPEKEQ